MIMRIINQNFWRNGLDSPAARDSVLWHTIIRAPLFAKTIDGYSMIGPGQIWRRKHNGRWEYQQDPETAEDFEDRQW